MKSDFLLAITQLSAEKNLPKEVVIAAVEAALVSAYRKEHFVPNQNISVKVNPATGRVEVWAEKTVVEKVSDSRTELSRAEARRTKSDAKVGDLLIVESTPPNAGRIAAQTAKQVILQRLHEAEHSAIFEEYAGKENDIVTGVVQRIEPKQIFINLGRTEAILLASEQMPNERYRVGQRLRVYLLEVNRTTKGPRVLVSRSHPNLLRRLFELEIPEVYNGIVEIKSVAREAGYRSKVAVAARQEGIDPVGCCVGLRGIRIQNIVNELNGEKIDVVLWNEDPALFIANALSPAQVAGVTLGDGIASVVVPDKQLSLAIGKDGQNARLAAKLTGWKIDIKSVSVAEAEKAAAKPAEAELPPAVAEEVPAAAPEVAEKVPAKARGKVTEKIEAVPAEAEVVAEAAKPAEEKIEEIEAVPEIPVEAEAEKPEEEAEEGEEIPLPVAESQVPAKSKIRFAEDIFVGGAPKPGSRMRKKKKKKTVMSREKADASSRPIKAREVPSVSDDEY